MKDLPESLRHVDWEKTTWEGARREQLRRWAELPLDRIIASLEEMHALAGGTPSDRTEESRGPERSPPCGT